MLHDGGVDVSHCGPATCVAVNTGWWSMTSLNTENTVEIFSTCCSVIALCHAVEGALSLFNATVAVE